MPPYVSLTEIWLEKISFQNLISIKRYRGKTLGGRSRHPTPRSGRVNIIMITLFLVTPYAEESSGYKTK